MRFDGVIYCPLYEEVSQLQRVIPPEEDYSAEFGFIAYSAQCGGHKILVLSPDQMSCSVAGDVIRRTRGMHDFRYVICIGIAGSLDDDLSYGDVCYSQEIFDVTENQKFHNRRVKFNPRVFSSHVGSAKKMGIITAYALISHHYRDWQKDCVSNSDAELANPFRLSPPKCLSGPIVCGPVLADAKMKRQLKDINRKVLAIETESAGLFQALRDEMEIEIVSVRGISDLADSQKANDEASVGGAYRRIAAYNAASFLVMQIRHNSFFSQALRERVSKTAVDVVNDNPVEIALGKIADLTEEALAELSPDYKALGKGYRLPVPRVKEIDGDDPSQMLEPFELISSSRLAIINVPSTYPDRGLPHVYAKNLAGSIINGRIVLPVAVDAADIRPPNGSIKLAASARGVNNLLGDEGVHPVIVIYNFPSSSETRRAHLLSQMRDMPECNFVIMTTDAGDALSLDEVAASSWKRYQLCAVSFRSLVDFLNAQFQIDSGEAEVIALRLSETFRSFNVSAHPSYFAGIPRELLTRFSEVSHRAEIIDLAVTGFLSFFGAGDTKDVSLKIRTRRLFLRDLAYRIKFQKEKFDMPDLIRHVENYSLEKDLGIDALEFVQSFIKNGIINNLNGRIEFTIPFIESYLLAEKLSSSPDEAKAYFDPIKGEIDFRTFELYAEIGLSDGVLEDVCGRISAHIRRFSQMIGDSPYTSFLGGDGGSYKRSGHVLTSGDIKPGMFRDYRRLVRHRSNLEKMAEEILVGTPRAGAKQRLLDITEKISDEAKAQRQAEDDGRANSAESEIGRDWVMGVILLGSAAEDLNAGTKRHLVADLLRLATLISDDWIRSRAAVDYDDIKSQILKEVLDGGASIPEEKAREFVNMTVDVVEIREVSTPLYSIMHILSEYARNGVLLHSLSPLRPEDSVEELFKSLWSLELSAAQGAKELQRVVKALPKHPFLRVSIANYLLSRAFWYKSNPGTRSKYVEGARDVLKPLEVSVDNNTLEKTVSDAPRPA